MFPRRPDRLWLRTRLRRNNVGNTPKVRRVKDRQKAAPAARTAAPGAVWIPYQPDLDPALIEDLEGYARRAEVIVSPYPGLDSPIVLSAWGRQLRLATVDDAVIDQFYRAFRARTAPEPGASC